MPSGGKKIDLKALSAKDAISKVKSAADREIRKINSSARSGIARVASAAHASIRALSSKAR